MKYNEIKQMQTTQLNEKIASLYMELIKLAGSAATGATPKSPSLIRLTKKTIAQIKTELTARQAK